MQSNLYVESLVYLHTVRVHYFNLLEAENMTGYYCSVPLNIIIGVDNYTLRNGTRLINAKNTNIFFIQNQPKDM